MCSPIFRARADALSWALRSPLWHLRSECMCFLWILDHQRQSRTVHCGKIIQLTTRVFSLPLTSAASEPKVSREFSLHSHLFFTSLPFGDCPFTLTHKCNQWSPCYGSNEYFSVFFSLDPLVEFSTIDQFLLFLVLMTYIALSFSFISLPSLFLDSLPGSIFL